MLSVLFWLVVTPLLLILVGVVWLALLGTMVRWIVGR